jgi:hypothetical protein
MTKELRDLLEAQAQDLEDLDSISWGMEEGILISGRDALEIVNLYDLAVKAYKQLIEVKLLLEK